MEVLKVTKEEKEQVRKFFDTDQKRIDQDLSLIREWYKKQPHLPQNLKDDDFLESTLKGSKFRVGITKEKIDSYFSVKTAYKDIFSGFNELIPSKIYATFLPIPQLTKDQERIIIIKMVNLDINAYKFDAFVKLFMAMGEIMTYFDYAKGIRAIVDLSGMRLEHIMKINVSILQKAVVAYQDGFSNKILGIECFNSPSYVNTLMGVLKKIMKPKIFNKIRLHDNLESLYSLVPKEYLPQDFGGSQDSIEHLLKQWDEEFKNRQVFLTEVVQRGSNEKLRSGKSKYDNDIFGMEGSFRKIDLD